MRAYFAVTWESGELALNTIKQIWLSLYPWAKDWLLLIVWNTVKLNPENVVEDANRPIQKVTYNSVPKPYDEKFGDSLQTEHVDHDGDDNADDGDECDHCHRPPSSFWRPLTSDLSWKVNCTYIFTGLTSALKSSSNKLEMTFDLWAGPLKSTLIPWRVFVVPLS